MDPSQLTEAFKYIMVASAVLMAALWIVCSRKSSNKINILLRGAAFFVIIPELLPAYSYPGLAFGLIPVIFEEILKVASIIHERSRINIALTVSVFAIVETLLDKPFYADEFVRAGIIRDPLSLGIFVLVSLTPALMHFATATLYAILSERRAYAFSVCCAIHWILNYSVDLFFPNELFEIFEFLFFLAMCAILVRVLAGIRRRRPNFLEGHQ